MTLASISPTSLHRTFAILCLLTITSLPAAERTEPQVLIYKDDHFRYIESNGIPDHRPGKFPNKNNPNAIQPQTYRYRIPLKPVLAYHPSPIGFNLFGFALNGVPFDPSANEFWKNDRILGWQYEALSKKGINLGIDESNAHVQPSGAYHYHGSPKGFITKNNANAKVTMIGYAADGFPIYGAYGYENPTDPSSRVVLMKPSYQLKKGTRPSGPGGTYDGTFVQYYEYVPGSGHLDECNGREGVTPEYPEGTYHYYITEDFPFIPRFVRGVRDPSFFRHHGGPPGGGMRPPPPF
jgi:hypothetical protein